jgi:hypothetical protein
MNEYEEDLVGFVVEKERKDGLDHGDGGKGFGERVD